jgi:tetrahydromethanopterin S-methyltransferase subunit F
MKKLLLFFITTTVGFSSQAQLNKGRVLLGGGIGFGNGEQTTFSGNTSATKKSAGFSIYPSAGVFVKDNLLVGVDMAYGHARFEDAQSSASIDTRNSYSAGIFATRFLPLGSGFFFSGTAGVGYGFSKEESTSAQTGTNINTIKSNGVSASLYPGVSYIVHKRFMIGLRLVDLFRVQYTWREQSGPNDVLQNRDHYLSAGVAAGGTVSFNIGFNYLLGK